MTDYGKIAQYVGSMVGNSFKSKSEFTDEMLNSSTSSKTNSTGDTRNTLFYKDGELIGEMHLDNNDKYSVFATDHREDINYNFPNENGRFTEISFDGCSITDANENGILDNEDEISCNDLGPMTLREFLTQYFKK